MVKIAVISNAAALVNAYGPRNLARISIEHDKTLAYYSSDYAWDGY